LDTAFVFFVGLIAGTLGGIIGTGSSIILMPVLVYAFGPKEAVPVMALAAVLANIARVGTWWREVDWKAALTYSAIAVPAAALGAFTLLSLPARLIDFAIGLFFLGMIPLRRWLARSHRKPHLGYLGLAGGIIGYVTGIVVSTGPISVPLFFAYGLTKGALIGTEAASSLAVYTSKTVIFGGFGALPWPIVLEGLATGASLMIGAVVAKRVLVKIDARTFDLMLDGLMLVSGLVLLWTALDFKP
jgi:uncharacterized membrane protein YfcA